MFGEIICAAIIIYVLFYILILCCIDCDLQLLFNEKFGKSISHLRGQVVFITGASSGIGKHTAYALAKHGVRLVLAARRQELLIEVKNQCLVLSKGKLTSNDILVMPMNMLDYASHQQSFDIALAHFGQIDVLFNNAGRSQRATWEDIHYLVDKELFDLNVFSVINLTRVAIHYFNSRGNGHVAVTSSGAGLFGAPYSASYTGSKHAIHGYYNSLRLEKQDSKVKLAVTIICPGPTSTEFLQECFTNNHGEKYGIDVKETDRRMSGERCGHLCAIALANKSTEAWMSIFPVLHILYAYVYYPTLVNFIFRIFGTKRFFRFRDSTDPTFFKEKKSN